MNIGQRNVLQPLCLWGPWAFLSGVPASPSLCYQMTAGHLVKLALR